VLDTAAAPHKIMSITMLVPKKRGILMRSNHTTTGLSVYAMNIPNRSGIKNLCAHCSEKIRATVAKMANAIPRASTWTAIRDGNDDISVSEA